MQVKSESSRSRSMESVTQGCLSADDKLLLFADFHGNANKSEVARKWGINRSYLYDIVKECETFILTGFSQRRRGRKLTGEPDNLADAVARIKSLEEEILRIDEERELYYVQSEFMKVRLKWAEREASELRGDVAPDCVDETSSAEISKNRKKHLKKKRKQKR